MISIYMNNIIPPVTYCNFILGMAISLLYVRLRMGFGGINRKKGISYLLILLIIRTALVILIYYKVISDTFLGIGFLYISGTILDVGELYLFFLWIGEYSYIRLLCCGVVIISWYGVYLIGWNPIIYHIISMLFVIMMRPATSEWTDVIKKIEHYDRF